MPDRAEVEKIRPGQANGFIGWGKQCIKKVPGFQLADTIRRKVKMHYHARGLTEMAPPPLTIMLETSSLCNLSCAKCAHKSSERSNGLMDTKMAIDLVDQAADMGIKNVCLSMLGEPLMHRELESIISRVREKGIHSYLVTNAMLLTPERSASLIEAGITQIVVSIDGWDKASYAERQGGARLDRVLDNLRGLREIKENNNRPSLASVTVVDTESKKHLARIKKLLSGCVEHLRLIPLIDFGIPGHEIDPNLLLGTRSWRRVPCENLWQVLGVGWDGRVTACCNDHNYLLAYHHVHDAPLADIWQSPTIKEWRRQHLDGQFESMPMCGGCTYDWIHSLSFQRIKSGFVGRAGGSESMGGRGADEV